MIAAISSPSSSWPLSLSLTRIRSHIRMHIRTHSHALSLGLSSQFWETKIRLNTATHSKYLIATPKENMCVRLRERVHGRVKYWMRERERGRRKREKGLKVLSNVKAIIILNIHWRHRSKSPSRWHLFRNLWF